MTSKLALKRSGSLSFKWRSVTWGCDTGIRPCFVGFFAEVAWYEGFDHVTFQVFGKTLPDDRRRHMPAAEAGNARQLLILLNNCLGLAIYVLDGNFNRNFPPGAAAGLSGAHICLSGFDRSNRSISELDYEFKRYWL